MGIFNEFNKKEKPVFTGSRFGFGSGGGGVVVSEGPGGGGLIPDNMGSGGVIEVTGGTIRHVFISQERFQKPGPEHPGTVQYLVLGGGGGGGGAHHGGGGGSGGLVIRYISPH